MIDEKALVEELEGIGAELKYQFNKTRSYEFALELSGIETAINTVKKQKKLKILEKENGANTGQFPSALLMEWDIVTNQLRRNKH